MPKAAAALAIQNKIHERNFIFMTYEEIKNNETIKIYIQKADDSLKAMGYTEHSFAHIGVVAERAGYILKTLGYPARLVELAKIAGYLHDIGNLINREDHSQSGAIMAYRFLEENNFDPAEIAEIVTAIGNHDEGSGVPVSPLAAAMIIADKSDVRRNRVRNNDIPSFDIHDRVNYSVIESDLKINQAHSLIKLKLTIDTHFNPISEFFEIFMKRLLLCKKAAETLGLQFRLIINEQQLM